MLAVLCELHKHMTSPRKMPEMINKDAVRQRSQFRVRCLNGDLDLVTEKRKYGKVVTLLKRVDNPAELLKKLQRSFGVGGTAQGTNIEIQGDQINRVRSLLLGSYANSLHGLKRDLLPPPPELDKKPQNLDGPSLEGMSENEKGHFHNWFVENNDGANTHDIFCGAQEARKKRTKPRHKIKSNVTNAVCSQSGRGVKNSKPRCPEGWPYCSGWCYEPDSDGEHDYIADVDFPWLLHEELDREVKEADAIMASGGWNCVNSAVSGGANVYGVRASFVNSNHPEASDWHYVELALKYLGLTAESCVIKDASIAHRLRNKSKISGMGTLRSKHKDKIEKRAAKRITEAARKSNSSMSSYSQITQKKVKKKPFFASRANNSKPVLTVEDHNEDITPYRDILESSNGKQDVDDFDDYQQQADLLPQNTLENHVESLGLRRYGRSDGSSSQRLPSSSVTFEESKPVGLFLNHDSNNFDSTFPQLERSSSKLPCAKKSQRHRRKKPATQNTAEDLKLKEDEMLRRALAASEESSKREEAAKRARESEQDLALRWALEESSRLEKDMEIASRMSFGDEEGVCSDDGLDKFSDHDMDDEKDNESSAFKEALTVLCMMGFKDDARTRSVLMNSAGYDVGFAVEALLSTTNFARQGDVERIAAEEGEDDNDDGRDSHFCHSTISFNECQKSRFIGGEGNFSGANVNECNFDSWLGSALHRAGIDDADTYKEYICSFLIAMKDDAIQSAEPDSKEGKLLTHSTSLAGLLVDILPSANDVALQALAYEVTAAYFREW